MHTNERVLFIDDEETVRNAFARALSRKGYRVDVADSLDAALAFARSEAYAVVAVDYRLGGQDGLSVTDALEHFQPDATYMLISGKVDLDVAVEAVNDHNVSYVVCKPWDLNQLYSLLQRSVNDHLERVMRRGVEASAVRMSQEISDQRRRVQEAVSAAEPRVLTETLLGVLQVRGHETTAHCRRVAAFSLAMARQLGITGEALASIERGALLHDVGTIGVPDLVFTKAGALTDAEWQSMRKHPEIGARMLEGLDNLRGAMEIVLQHHERWDGSGYPAKLRGADIVIGARIFAVADALDALTSPRSYRIPMDLGDAIHDVAALSSVRYDPRVIAALQGIPTDELRAVCAAHPDVDAVQR
jgi:putative nucleotidyltransferase with HDIG domain